LGKSSRTGIGRTGIGWTGTEGTSGVENRLPKK